MTLEEIAKLSREELIKLKVQLDKFLDLNSLFDELYAEIARFMSNPLFYRDIIQDIYMNASMLAAAPIENEIEIYKTQLKNLELQIAENDKRIKLNQNSNLDSIADKLQNHGDLIAPGVQSGYDRKNVLIASQSRLLAHKQLLEEQLAIANADLVKLQKDDKEAAQTKQVALEEIARMEELLSAQSDADQKIIEELSKTILALEKSCHEQQAEIELADKIIATNAMLADSAQSNKQERMEKLKTLKQKMTLVHTTLREKKMERALFVKTTTAKINDSRVTLDKQFLTDFRIHYLNHHYRGATCRRDAKGSISDFLSCYFYQMVDSNCDLGSITEDQVMLTKHCHKLYSCLAYAPPGLNGLVHINSGMQTLENLDNVTIRTAFRLKMSTVDPNSDFFNTDNIKARLEIYHNSLGPLETSLKEFVDFLEKLVKTKYARSSFFKKSELQAAWEVQIKVFKDFMPRMKENRKFAMELNTDVLSWYFRFLYRLDSLGSSTNSLSSGEISPNARISPAMSVENLDASVGSDHSHSPAQ